MADEAKVDGVDDVRVPTPWGQFLRWTGPPRGYQLTRWLILRLLGFVYVFAFLGLICQGPALLGSHGLTPIATYIDLIRGDGATFWDAPSLFWWGASDSVLMGWAIVGLALSLACLVGYANLPSLLALWFIYGSYERVGQARRRRGCASSVTAITCSRTARRRGGRASSSIPRGYSRSRRTRPV